MTKELIKSQLAPFGLDAAAQERIASEVHRRIQFEAKIISNRSHLLTLETAYREIFAIVSRFITPYQEARSFTEANLTAMLCNRVRDAVGSLTYSGRYAWRLGSGVGPDDTAPPPEPPKSIGDKRLRRHQRRGGFPPK